MAQVFSRALAVLVPELERTRFAATRRPRASRRHAAHGRHIPAAVKRAVWERDGGQCPFVSDAGQRCQACERLEFDHIDPVARDGEATVENLRLRCRAHNQFGAERLLGTGFMDDKREAARHRAEARREEARREAEAKREESRRQAEAKRAAAEERAQAEAAAAAEEMDPDKSVVPWLRELGFKLDEIRRAVAQCEFAADATIEDRIRTALRFLAPKSARRALHVTSSPA